MRSTGFDRMDVSTSLPDDRKFRALARRHPDRLAVAAWAYVGLLAMSWREGERVTLEEGWPTTLPYDDAAADALRDVGLVDDEYRVPEHAWAEWYGSAAERRRLGRERQLRADIKRGHTNPPESPPGPPSTSVSQTDSQSGRPNVGTNVGPTLAVGTTNGRDLYTCPGCGDLLDDKHPNVIVRDPSGQRWHVTCPTLEAASA